MPFESQSSETESWLTRKVEDDPEVKKAWAETIGLKGTIRHMFPYDKLENPFEDSSELKEKEKKFIPIPERNAMNKKSEKFKSQGNIALRKGNYDTAINKYTRAIKEAKVENHVYYANRAQAHFQLKNYEECIKDCDEAIRIEPKFMKSYYRKSMSYRKLENSLEALHTAQQGLNIESDNKELNELHDWLDDYVDYNHIDLDFDA